MKSKVLNNATWIIGAKIVQSVLSLIITGFTARYLGPDNFGLINYAASIVAFATPIAQLGLGAIQVQEIVNRPEKEGETIGTSLILSIISAILCLIGVLTFTFVMNGNEKDTLIVCSLYSLVLFFQGAEIIQFWFQAKYKAKYSSLTSLFAYVVISVYRIYLLMTGKSIYWFAIVNSLDYLVIIGILLVIYHKLGGQKLKFSIARSKEMLSKSVYYILANLMVVIFTQTDKIMLKNMIDNASTAYYTVAVTWATVANFVFAAIIDSFRPMIFESYNESKEKFENNMAMLYSVIIYLAVLYSLGITIFAGLIIRIIYGVNYLAAVSPLRIVVWFTIFSFIGNIRNIWILAENQQKHLWVINLSGAIANVALNWYLIPRMGINGAALASLVTQFFSNIVVSYLIKGTRKNTYIMLKGLNPKFIFDFVNEHFNLSFLRKVK